MTEHDLKEALAGVLKNLGFPQADVDVSPPRDPSHGDASTSVAMRLAKEAGRNPRELADEVVAALELPLEFVEEVTVAGPGFINFRFGRTWYEESLKDIVRAGDDYGKSDVSAGRKIQTPRPSRQRAATLPEPLLLRSAGNSHSRRTANSRVI